MVFILLVAGGVCFFLAFKAEDGVQKDEFERTNQHGVRQYESWDEHKNQRLKNNAKMGSSVILSVIGCILVLAGVLLWAANSWVAN